MDDEDYEDPMPMIPPSPTRRPAGVPEAEPTMMSRLHDAALDFTAPLRYGTSPSEKIRMMTQGGIPGIPEKHGTGLHGEAQSYVDPLDPEAERYASNYLGAKKYGAIPATLFNAIALGDIGDIATGARPSDVMQRKATGIEGALRGAPDTSPMVEAILRRLQSGLRGGL